MGIRILDVTLCKGPVHCAMLGGEFSLHDADAKLRQHTAACGGAFAGPIRRTSCHADRSALLHGPCDGPRVEKGYPHVLHHGRVDGVSVPTTHLQLLA